MSSVDATKTGNPYAPFKSRLDWQVARWGKLRGSGSTAFTEFLEIEGVAERLALSYKNTRELNKLVDKKLPNARPQFRREEIIVGGEAFEVYARDVLECVEALFGDPEFAPLLLLVPERHYADEDCTIRVYFDINTGKWWWATQKEIEKTNPGATVIPIIISSDKTQLTVFGNKTAYPVYMTIGNLPKDIRCKPSRRGQILLAYLPTTRLLHITNKAARRRMLANLFHGCLSQILEPLAAVGLTGMPIASGDGIVRRGHPILAVYVGDYPEQVLVTCCKTGECPKCPVPRDEVGDTCDTSRPLRKLQEVLDALDTLDEGPRAFKKACEAIGFKPIVQPFWANLPYTNIYYAITPDILHQLYQGVVKHLISWIREAFGDEEIDARCRRFPPNHHLRHFSKGISNMSRVTGKEHQDICRILLGLIVGLPLPNGISSVRLVRATRAVLDFLYLAQYTTHTSRTLRLLDDALEAFHANKRSIEFYGTTDNYDTQYSERLHIDMAKDAYRATNKKDELTQMTKWLERREKILRHEKYIAWRMLPVTTHLPPPTVAAALPQVDEPPTGNDQSLSLVRHPGGRPQDPVNKPKRRIEMTRHPSVKAVPLDHLGERYGALYFRDALSRFVVQHNHPEYTRAQLERASASVYFNFHKIPAFHKVKFWLDDPHGFPDADLRDVIHCRPIRQNKYGDDIPGRFDTALVRLPGVELAGVQGNSQEHIISGFCVAQVRLVFKLPDKAMPELFPHLPVAQQPNHLAYVEWFTPFDATAAHHGLYKVKRSIRGRARLASVIPVEQLYRSCHLLPEFGPVAPRDWTTYNILDACPSFLVNSFSDRHMYKLMY
ncbi:hypothetical protein L226DRAFT_462412 [Lentinus tigrinus ALCF2SS1-7]|uniref:uncharacterized protein n=1 Tax=Lentinus tigrinus ALCF2SS1-7 TaxID=1328758 RepID=UPI001165E9B8|nr:hypothetical protein L226DRAFT_462412 [Lentinus tigrinus ALCF2SS1-7]